MSEMTKDDLDRLGAKWIDRIKTAEKREEHWCKAAERAEAAFLVDVDGENAKHIPDFNILHSNVETIVPAIYNSTPIPDIRARHNRDDKIAKEASDIIEAAIITTIDDSRLDAEMEGVAQDSNMAGRGVIRVRFDADVEEIPAQTQVVPMMDEMGGMVEQEIEVAPAQTITSNETIYYENVSWADYREGPAKRWRDVPWVGYKHAISEADKKRLESDDVAKAYADEPDADNEELDVDVWEIWCKETSKVYFVIESNSRVLSVMDDPLKLTGFFPQPAPVQPITGTGRRTPVCPYAVYQKLAEELDAITVRIDGLVSGLKVRGIVATGAEVIEELASAGDNTIITAGDLEGLMAMGGIEKAIAWWPIDKAVAVLRELYLAREQVKATIYEVTGISDIVRGASNSGETATAQQIKTQWGSMRIKKLQRLIERCVRDVFVISAEIIAQHFSQETLQKMSGIQISPEAMQLLQKPLDHYRIDVESDSTVRADLTRMRGEMSEFLQGTASFFETMAPVVQQSPKVAGPVAALYSSFARQFSLGREAEAALDQMVQLAQEASEQPDPAQAMMEAQRQIEEQIRQFEQGVKTQELQIKNMDLQIKGMDVKNRAQIEAKKVGLDEDRLTLDERKAEVDAMAKMVEMDMEEEQQRAVKFGNKENANV